MLCDLCLYAVFPSLCLIAHHAVAAQSILPLSNAFATTGITAAFVLLAIVRPLHLIAHPGCLYPPSRLRDVLPRMYTCTRRSEAIMMSQVMSANNWTAHMLIWQVRSTPGGLAPEE